MKHVIAFLLLLLASNFLQAQDGGRIILRLNTGVEVKSKPLCNRSGIGQEDVDQVSKSNGAISSKRISGKRSETPKVYVIQFPEGTDLAPILQAYRALPVVANAEHDAMGGGGGQRSFVPNDPEYFRQWGLKNDGTFSLHPATAGADIDMENAWDIEQGSDNVTVAIIDSGARLQHPDFAGRIWTNTAEIPGNGIDDDGNGYIDDVTGWDFANNDNDPTDDQGHGTNVASIVGAVGNNEIGFAGVDMNCKLMILKALNSSNQGWYSWWVEAMYYAVDNGANVINMSLGGTDPFAEMQTAVDHALQNNVLVVACMMNTNASTPFIPAALNGVLSVGATSPDDSRAVPFNWSSSSGSNYGSHIDVVAPGDYVYGLHFNSDAVFTSFWSGTSQATPHVAALASLLIAQDPTSTPGEVADIIRNTAEDQVGDPLEDLPGWDQYYGHGRINAFLALGGSVGIERAAAPTFSLYPNPTTGVLNLTLNEPSFISLIDGSGRTVLDQRYTAGLHVLDAGTAPGVYLVRVTSEQEHSSMRLVVQ